MLLTFFFHTFEKQNHHKHKRKGNIMTNKRKLKQMINKVCGELFSECVAASLYNGKPDQETVNALLSSILIMQSDFLKRISHPEPGMPAQQYFKTLTLDFSKSVNEIIDQIQNLS